MHFQSRGPQVLRDKGFSSQAVLSKVLGRRFEFSFVRCLELFAFPWSRWYVGTPVFLVHVIGADRDVQHVSAGSSVSQVSQDTETGDNIDR